jgi:hypothetical protein
LTRSTPRDDTWDISGDGWNGAFHFVTSDWNQGAIHNHVGRRDDVDHGWSAVVFLSPKPDPRRGTTFWRSRATGKCYSLESVYDSRFSQYELVLDLENVYNRAVFFFGSVLHRAGRGFGKSLTDSRMLQAFFFNVERNTAA